MEALSINCVILVLIVTTLLQSIQVIDSLFEAMFDRTEPIYKNDTIYADLNNIRLKKVNRTHQSLIGTFEFFQDIGNDYELTGYLSQKAGNEFRRTPYKLGPNKFCTYMDSEKMFVPEARKVSNYPPVGTCPWLKGEYYITGYSIDLSTVPNIFQTGDYLLEIQVTKGTSLVNGFRIYVKLVNVF